MPAFLPRILEQPLQKSLKSILLLGPRQTGKSSLIKKLSPKLQINLAKEDVFEKYAHDASLLEQQINAQHPKTIFIDEVQRLPSLLNTIQALIDDSNGHLKFYLTGSSARKLKRGKANLLPGRLFTYQMSALIAAELDYQVDTNQALSFGLLPEIYLTRNPSFQSKLLRSYSGTYLKEEIQAEALTRHIEGFSRFLYIAAAHSGHYLDLSKLASLASIPRDRAARYFEILEDTLLVRCTAFSKNITKRLIKHPKFYFFDTGLLNALLKNFEVSPDRKGLLFEHLIFNQLQHSAYAYDLELEISSYRTSNGSEVDFIVEANHALYAIDVKHTTNIGNSDLRGLKGFAQSYNSPHTPMIWYMGKEQRKIEDIHIYPWQQGLLTVLIYHIV